MKIANQQLISGRVYLAGPMSGISQMNFPAFDAAAETLRARGFDVVSPAELDSPKERAAALASVDGIMPPNAEASWGVLLGRDLKIIADEGIEAVIVLPGWEGSKGARLETFTARLLNLPIFSYPLLLPVAEYAIHKAHGLPAAPPAFPTTGYGQPVTRPVSFGETWEEGMNPEIYVDQQTGGRKEKKPENYALIPWEQMDEVARLYDRGAQKYEPHNWTKGYPWSLSFNSLIRHAKAFWESEELDPETKCHHLASVVFHALALLHFTQHHPDLDDRKKSCPT